MTIQGWRLPLFLRSLGSNLHHAYRTMGDAARWRLRPACDEGRSYSGAAVRV